MVTSGWMCTCTPHGSRQVKWARLSSRSLWGWLDSTLGPLVAPQSYGGLTIVLDHV